MVNGYPLQGFGMPGADPFAQGMRIALETAAIDWRK